MNVGDYQLKKENESRYMGERESQEDRSSMRLFLKRLSAAVLLSFRGQDGKK